MHKPTYLQTIRLIERLHRSLHENIRAAFVAMGWDDITPSQAILLFNLGAEELSTTEITVRGIYNGSNAAYNVKKLVEGGYLTQARSDADKRLIRVKRTGKGEEVAEVVDELYDKHLKAIPVADGVTPESIGDISRELGRLERFWSDLTSHRVVV